MNALRLPIILIAAYALVDSYLTLVFASTGQPWDQASLPAMIVTFPWKVWNGY